MKTIQCSHCGAHISVRDRVCSWCGTPNPAYEPPEDAVNALLADGLRAYQQQEYARAARDYRLAIEQDPDVFDAYFYLAASLTALGRYAEAVRAMHQARKVRPGSAVVDYNLGVLYRRIGQAREARYHLEEALRKADTDVALQDRGAMKRRVKEELRALNHVQA